MSDDSANGFIWSMIVASYNRRKVTTGRLQCLRSKMYKRGEGKCQFKCQFAKAKALCPVFVDILGEHCLGIDEVGSYLYLCYECFVQMYDVLANPDMFLSDIEAKTLLENADKFLLYYKALHTVVGLPKFRITNKFHVLHHIAYLSRYQHPRGSWTYMWEDLMGKLFHISKACAVGTPMHVVSEKTMENFAILANRRLKDARRDL